MTFMEHMEHMEHGWIVHPAFIFHILHYFHFLHYQKTIFNCSTCDTKKYQIHTNVACSVTDT